MKYGECIKQVDEIVSRIFDEAIEEGSITFDDEIERGVIEKKLRSDITLFIFKNFGLEADNEPKEIYWDIVEGAPCPHCGNSDLDYDIVTEDDGSQHDVVDCPKCKNRLYYEVYY